MVVKAFDGNLYACVNDKDVHILEAISKHSAKSKDIDADYEPPKQKKKYIPPINHLWRRSAFQKFVMSRYFKYGAE